MQRCPRCRISIHLISSETICTAGEPPWRRTRSAMSSAVGRGPAEATVVRLAPSTPKMVTHGRVASARVIPPRPKMVGEGIAPPRPKPIAKDGGVSSVEVGFVPPTPKTSKLLPPTPKTSTTPKISRPPPKRMPTSKMGPVRPQTRPHQPCPAAKCPKMPPTVTTSGARAKQVGAPSPVPPKHSTLVALCSLLGI